MINNSIIKERSKMDIYKRIEESTIAEDKKIDIYNLHKENQINPSLIEKYGKLWAVARRKKKAADNNVKVVYAKVEKQVRIDPEKFGIELVLDSKGNSKAPTEPTIKTAVLLSKEYTKAYEEYLDACEQEDLMDVGRDTINDRRSALGEERALFLSGYYSDPAIPKEFNDKQIDKDKSKRKRLIKKSKENK